jgi:hypothetical protein
MRKREKGICDQYAGKQSKVAGDLLVAAAACINSVA